MGFFDTITNIFFGTERVKASKAECKAKKDKAKTDYDAVMKQIEAECEASLTKAKEADKAKEASQPQPPTTAPSTRPAEATDNRFFSNNNTPSAVEPNRKDNQTGNQNNYMGGKKGGKSKKRSKSNRKRTRKYK
jgi:hypothetical protein